MTSPFANLDPEQRRALEAAMGARTDGGGIASAPPPPPLIPPSIAYAPAGATAPGAPATPQQLTAATIRRRKQGASRFTFVLAHTLDEHGNPTSVVVRKFDLMDFAWIGSLPSSLQAEVVAMTKRVDQAKVEKVVEDDSLDGLNAAETESVWGAFALFADAAVIAGFLQPKVYQTDEEADRHGGVCLTDIDSRDRMVYAASLMGSRAEVAALLVPFPDGPGAPGGAVPHDRRGDAVPGDGAAQPGAAAAPDLSLFGPRR